MSDRFGPGWLVAALLVGAGVAVVLVDWLLRFSITPEWVVAVGGLGAFGATAWLAWLTLRSVLATERMAAAGRENQVAIARALLEDVRRIRGELGPRPDGQNVPPLQEMIVPRVHPWLHPIIPQIALSDAAVVGAFMALERGLDNFDSALAGFHSTRVKQDETLRQRDDLFGLYQTAGTKPETVTAYLELSHAADIGEQNLRTALRLAETTYRMCHSELDKIEGLLKPIAGALTA
jgi:hypothetical protein